MTVPPGVRSPTAQGVERGHPVRLSAKRERILNITSALIVLRTLADRMSALQAFFKDRAVTTGVALPDGRASDMRLCDCGIDSRIKIGLAFEHHNE